MSAPSPYRVAAERAPEVRPLSRAAVVRPVEIDVEPVTGEYEFDPDETSEPVAAAVDGLLVLGLLVCSAIVVVVVATYFY